MADENNKPFVALRVQSDEPITNKKRKQVPIELTFNGIKRSVFTSIGEKHILHGISGTVKPGEVTALMGPSGSGKTTLLNIIGGRSENFQGEIMLNGCSFNKGMKRNIAYVMQADVFTMNLTVVQQLTFTALLRLKGSKKDKIAKVDQVITSLGLEKCRNSKLYAISGGERKRVNIGTELLTDPMLVLLDEPTSGLDSSAALTLMNVLQDLAQGGMTILACIHQPSSRLFQSFDKLLLLSEGRQMYFGSPSDASSHFALHGFQCPEQYNPADYIMDVVTKPEARSLLAEVHEKEYTKNGPIVPVATSTENSKPDDESKWAVSWSTQTIVLTQRAMLDTSLNIFTWINLVETLGLAIICGSVWWQVPNTESAYTDKVSLLFFLMLFWPLHAQFQATQQLPMERPILVKERNSGSYRLSAYFTAVTLASGPLSLILPIINITAVYFMAGLNPDPANFFGFLFSELLAILLCQSLGLLIGICVTDLKKGLAVSLLLNMLLMLVGGFFVKSLPVFVSWIKYLSPFYYTFNLAEYFQFSNDQPITCDMRGAVIPICEGKESITGYELLSSFDVQPSPPWSWAVILLAMYLVFRFVGYFALRFLQHNRSNDR
jgi:ABC-type multidrug transport system ATPase subunit